LRNPVWSPDGKKIAFIAGLMSDEPSVGGDIYTIPATGGEPTNLTPDMKATANWLTWTPEGKKLSFAESIEGDAAAAPSTRQRAHRSSLARPGTGFRWSLGYQPLSGRDGKISAIIRSSLSDPPKSGPPNRLLAASHRSQRWRQPAWVLPRASIGKTMAQRSGLAHLSHDFDPRKISHDC